MPSSVMSKLECSISDDSNTAGVRAFLASSHSQSLGRAPAVSAVHASAPEDNKIDVLDEAEVI
jgi:hypothetical protein